MEGLHNVVGENKIKNREKPLAECKSKSQVRPEDFFRIYLEYSEKDKGLIWKRCPSKRVRKGTKVGTFKKGSKHYIFNLKNTTFNVADVVWWFHYGSFPQRPLGFKNGQAEDCRIENLYMLDDDLINENGQAKSNAFRQFNDISHGLTPELLFLDAFLHRAEYEARKGNPEAVRFVLGKDERLEWWLECSPIDKDGYIRYMKKVLIKEGVLKTGKGKYISYLRIIKRCRRGKPQIIKVV